MNVEIDGTNLKIDGEWIRIHCYPYARKLELVRKIAHAVRMAYPEGKVTCEACGSDAVVSFSSTEERQCGDCRKVTDWKLKPGQAPLVTNNRDKRKS